MTTAQPNTALWRAGVIETIGSYRRMIDAAVEQLSDAELMQRPGPGLNSVGVLLRHLGGNLQSRWTDFLTTDGEKPDRNREREFADWEGDRVSLIAYFDGGWCRLVEAVESITDETVTAEIQIRGEPHSVPSAVTRSIMHIAYHTGQVVLIARAAHTGDWTWLTIAPGASAAHNEKTWGSPSSRGVFGSEGE